jgi:hypothetical protein
MTPSRSTATAASGLLCRYQVKWECLWLMLPCVCVVGSGGGGGCIVEGMSEREMFVHLQSVVHWIFIASMFKAGLSVKCEHRPVTCGQGPHANDHKFIERIEQFDEQVIVLIR